jgi:hypothetical protein
MFTLIAAVLSLSGCVIYECSGGDCGHDWTDDWDCGHEDGDCTWDTAADDTATTEDTGEPEDPWADPYDLYLTPDEAEQGSAFIASLRAGLETDLTQVVAVDVNGQVEIGAMDARLHEVLLFVEVDPAAEVGPEPVFVTFSDGDVVLLEDPFTVYEAGSGHEPGTSDDGSGC